MMLFENPISIAEINTITIVGRAFSFCILPINIS